ncbi:hypothetical protein GGI07_000455 [Coemansia sp. Benny D115]|nr:hypothetical protein GGI07_000455 [Coemansia sp. Benny D115]
MSDPFNSLRRKPTATATYGRKAMTARRMGLSYISPSSDTTRQLKPISYPSLSSPVHAGKGSATDPDSDSSEAGSALFGPKAIAKAEHKQSAISRLDLLYESTKAVPQKHVPATARAVLDSTKDDWDILDTNPDRTAKDSAAASVAGDGKVATAQTRRIVRDNTDIIVDGNVPLTASRRDGDLPYKRPKPSKAALKPTIPAVLPELTAKNPRAQRIALAPAPAPTPAPEPRKPTAKDLGAKNGLKNRQQRRPDSKSKSKTKSHSEPELEPSHLKRTRSTNTQEKTVLRLGSKLSKTLRTSAKSSSKDTTDAANQASWDMDDFPAVCPIAQGPKATRRGAPAANRRGLKTYTSSRSSSPPPSLLPNQNASRRKGRRAAGSSRSVSNSTSTAASDADLDSCGVALQPSTPKAQVGNMQALRANQGPSSATSKRLQTKASIRNVVFTYGRTREDEFCDDLENTFTRPLGLQRTLGSGLGSGTGTGTGTGSQLLLEHFQMSSDADVDIDDSSFTGAANHYLMSRRQKTGVGGAAASGHLLDMVDMLGLTDNGSSNSSSSNGGKDFKTYRGGSFRQQIGDITKGLSAGATEGSPVAACHLLLECLSHLEFQEELFSSKHWLPTLLQALHRARSNPVVHPTTMAVIALAFNTPTQMQTLVFERQILETVAEVLKASAVSDVLSLRHRRDFESPNDRLFVEEACKLIRKHDLLGASLPVSTYNLALTALYSFTRTDDAAFLAMAGLLRNEMRESGCLGLIIERMFSRSIPEFIQPHIHAKSTSHARPGAGFAPFGDIVNQHKPCFGSMRALSFVSDSDDSDSANSENDDKWMDFDLPVERKDVRVRVPNPPSKRSNNDKGALKLEPSGVIPTFATVAVELELLRFCSSASDDNQDEILGAGASVTSLLSLLTMCQQTCAKLYGAQLVRALEIAALTLQLLVNLSNSSTVFCSQFVANKGLEVVSKSIVLVSQQIRPPNQQSSATRALDASDFSPRRKVLLDEASDLRYDVLLTTSALLTNLVESDSSSVVYFGHTYQSPRCLLEKSCFPECICNDRKPLTTLLTHAFLACCSSSDSSDDAAVAAGYISVLLGFLMRADTTGRTAILKQLPGCNASLVVDHIQKFIRISESVNQRFGGLIGGLAMAAQGAQSNRLADPADGLGDKPTTTITALSAPVGFTQSGMGGLTKQSTAFTSLQSVIEILNNI